jgi:hypothetical protein
MLLVLVAVQLLGGVAFASTCPDSCPDDAQGTSCPPICALCTSCTHAQTAIVQRSIVGTPLMATHHFVPQQRLSISSQLTSDIFHVPLLG